MSITRGRVKVNIGCGDWNFGKGWDHIDISPLMHIKSHNIFLDDYKDNSIHVIYCSHMIEYFTEKEASELLSAWYKKLKKGGLLQIAVPDFTAICMAHLKDNWTTERLNGPVLGHMFSAGGPISHKQLYDIRSLSYQLYKSGFSEVNQVKYFYPEHKDQSWAHLPDMNFQKGMSISLNVQCIKP